jgi:hypothetical protein
MVHTKEVFAKNVILNIMCDAVILSSAKNPLCDQGDPSLCSG